VTSNLQRMSEHALAFRVQRRPLEVGGDELAQAIGELEQHMKLQHTVAALEGETVGAGKLRASAGLFGGCESESALDRSRAAKAVGRAGPRVGCD
jgi:hypothetical protein